MSFFLECISCGGKSSRDEASTPLVQQPYMRTQSLDRNYRLRRFRSSTPSDWRPSLTAISEESSNQHLHEQQQRSAVRSEKMKRNRSRSSKSRARSDSVDCRCNSFSALFATSAATPFMF